MPTRRFSTMSMRPQPYAPTSAPSSSISSTRSMRLAVERDRHALLEADDDLASARAARRAGLRVSVYGSSGADDHGFSSTPHSIARPHMFSSIEYSFSFVAAIGMSHLAARSMQSARVRPHTRTGASTSRSGARMRDDTSKRTWSLPLPVQPCADRVGAVAAGRRDEVLDDHRPRQRRDERVLALVQRVGLQRGHEEVVARTRRARR